MAGSINLVLMGRSGAGKSSLANYLYGKELFKTGEGAPVTEFGKKWAMATLDDSPEAFNINVYDSPGLEPDNFPQWKHDFDMNMEHRTSPETWIHGAFYVINAASGRIEPTELDIIKNFPIEYAFPISVVLTNCDSADKGEVEAISRVIHNTVPHVKVNEVCSIERKKRGGQVVCKFGKEAVLKDHAHKVAFYFINRVGINLFSKDAPKCINNVFDRIISEMKSSDFGLMKLIKDGTDSLDDLFNEITGKLEEYVGKQVEYLAEPMADATEYLNQISEEFFILPEPMEVMEEIDIDSEMETIVPLLADIKSSFEYGSAWDKFAGIFKAGYALVTIKDQLIGGMDNMRRLILRKLQAKENACRTRLAEPDKYMNESLTTFKW